MLLIHQAMNSGRIVEDFLELGQLGRREVEPPLVGLIEVVVGTRSI
jgi:hypothetical protein